MSEQHPHNRIGNAIGECKKKLYDRLKSGSDLETALAQFFAELSEAFDHIVKFVKEAASPKGDPS